VPRPPQPSIPPGSVNEDQLQVWRQRQVRFIPFMDERMSVQVKLWNPSTMRAIPDGFHTNGKCNAFTFYLLAPATKLRKDLTFSVLILSQLLSSTEEKTKIMKDSRSELRRPGIVRDITMTLWSWCSCATATGPRQLPQSSMLDAAELHCTPTHDEKLIRHKIEYLTTGIDAFLTNFSTEIRVQFVSF